MLQKYLWIFLQQAAYSNLKNPSKCLANKCLVLLIFSGYFLVDNLNKRTEIVCWHHPQSQLFIRGKNEH